MLFSLAPGCGSGPGSVEDAGTDARVPDTGPRDEGVADLGDPDEGPPAPTCNDLTQNGDETDMDCGGECGATCEVGEGCVDDDDCESGRCTLDHCEATYTVGGTVSGLVGTGLVLQLASGEPLNVTEDGEFTLPGRLPAGASYAVEVATRPSAPGQECTLSFEAGQVGSENVTNVAVTCITDTYGVGGTVSGLLGADLTLQNNGADDLVVTGDGPFTFATEVAEGATYEVSVSVQPHTPTQACVAASASGSVGAAPVTSIAVTCTTRSFTVGGTVSGLTTDGLVLTNSGGDSLSVPSGATSFVFETTVSSGGSYDVEVATQPANLFCEVSAGNGDVTSGPVTSVSITCVTCGDDCWGETGCMTPAGRCVRFSCRPGSSGPSFCDTCLGWAEVSYDQWMNQGYCGDVIATYRAHYGQATACGGGPSCCGSAAACAGTDNAWHFSDGTATRYVGPCLGCADNTNCSNWDEVAGNTAYTRITACERVLSGP